MFTTWSWEIPKNLQKVNGDNVGELNHFWRTTKSVTELAFYNHPFKVSPLPVRSRREKKITPVTHLIGPFTV